MTRVLLGQRLRGRVRGEGGDPDGQGIADPLALRSGIARHEEQAEREREDVSRARCVVRRERLARGDEPANERSEVGIDGLGNVRIEVGADEEFGGGIELNAPAQHGHERAAEVGAVTGLACLLEARHAACDGSDKKGAGTLGPGDRREVGAVSRAVAHRPLGDAHLAGNASEREGRPAICCESMCRRIEHQFGVAHRSLLRLPT